MRSLASRFDSGSSKRKQADLLDQRPTDGDALALAAGELRGLAVEEVVDLQELRRPGDAALDLGAGELPRAEPELQVPAHRLGRVERVGLEDHGEAAVLGVEVGDLVPSMKIAPVVDARQAGEDVQQRGLAAARRAEEHEELAVLDPEIESLENGERAVFLDDVAELDGRHVAYPFMAPAVIPWTKNLPSRK